MKELKALLEGFEIELTSLSDYPDIPEIIEDGETLFDNALKKARSVSEYTGQIVIADDSGLEVDFLDGKPGVYSSRYAGPDVTYDDNNKKLLEDLQGVPADNRDAAFRCVLILYWPDGKYEAFEGKLKGTIIEKPAGYKGFGYDPIFFVTEYGKTLAEISAGDKNAISHRGRAFQKLKKSLQKIS